MENMMLIQVTNPKALVLLHELEERNMIKVIEENFAPAKPKLSNQFRGVFTNEDAKSFEEHTQKMRKEWNDT